MRVMYGIVSIRMRGRNAPTRSNGMKDNKATIETIWHDIIFS